MESHILGGKKILVSKVLEMGIFAVKKCACRSEMKWNELYVAIQILICIRLFLFEEDGKPDHLDRRLQNKSNNNQPNK